MIRYLNQLLKMDSWDHHMNIQWQEMTKDESKHSFHN